MESLYPSLDMEVCSLVVAKEMLECDITIEHLRWREICLYLRYQMDTELLLAWTTALEAEDVTSWLPDRATNLGRPPIFEASRSSANLEERFGPWLFLEDYPSEREIRTMFSVAIGVMVKRTMVATRSRPTIGT